MLCSATGLCLRGERPCSFVTATPTYFTLFSSCGRVEKGQNFLYLHFWHTLRATRLVAMVNRLLHVNVGNKLLGCSSCHYLVGCLTFAYYPISQFHSNIHSVLVCVSHFICRQTTTQLSSLGIMLLKSS